MTALTEYGLRIQIFYSPFSNSGVLDDDAMATIFSNLDQIVKIHDKIATNLSKVTEKGSAYRTEPIVQSFADCAQEFELYAVYCGNQHNARRLLNKLSQDAIFEKLLQKCESNPKLHKLTLADMLVKPMHRITRYPLLFKRLLPHLENDTKDKQALSDLLINIEATVKLINDTIKGREALYRIRMLDTILEFGIVADRFEIASTNRELLSEKSFTYWKRSTGTPTEITVLLFSDMIMLTKHKKPEQLQLLKPPIPLESAVFLEKPDGLEKNVFEIIHTEQESYVLQSLSSSDKQTWLQEAEAARIRYTSTMSETEKSYIKFQSARYKSPHIIGKRRTHDDGKASSKDEIGSRHMMSSRARKPSVEVVRFADGSRQEDIRRVASKNVAKQTNSYTTRYHEEGVECAVPTSDGENGDSTAAETPIIPELIRTGSIVSGRGSTHISPVEATEAERSRKASLNKQLMNIFRIGISSSPHTRESSIKSATNESTRSSTSSSVKNQTDIDSFLDGGGEQAEHIRKNGDKRSRGVLGFVKRSFMTQSPQQSPQQPNQHFSK